MKKKTALCFQNPVPNIFARFWAGPQLTATHHYVDSWGCPFNTWPLASQGLGQWVVPLPWWDNYLDTLNTFLSICKHTCSLGHRLLSTDTGKSSQNLTLPIEQELASIRSLSWRWCETPCCQRIQQLVFTVFGWLLRRYCRSEAARWTGLRPWKVGPEGSTGMERASSYSSHPSKGLQDPPCLRQHCRLTI